MYTCSVIHQIHCKYMQKTLVNVTLPHGTIAKVAKEAGVHRATVERVLEGRSENLRVKQVLVSTLKEIKDTNREFTNMANL